MKRILVSRFSALGDVAISVHVIKAFLEQNPDTEIILLTKPPFRQLFTFSDKITCFDVDLKNKHKGILGLKKLCKEITTEHNITHYADLHDVLRTKIIKFFLKNSIKKAKINKGRAEKRQLTKRHNKKLHQLKHSAQRYADVFTELGFKCDLSKHTAKPEYKPTSAINEFINSSSKKIGIAPFAKHKSKTYPIEKTEKIIAELCKKHAVFLFGGGQEEQKITEKWQKKHPNVYSLIGKFSMTDEINIINSCTSIITMDSGNMHLASLTDTKIISFWGATHPYLGFSPFNKPNSIFIQKNISCRPCSVFGNKECYKETWECLDIDEKDFLSVIN